MKNNFVAKYDFNRSSVHKSKKDYDRQKIHLSQQSYYRDKDLFGVAYDGHQGYKFGLLGPYKGFYGTLEFDEKWNSWGKIITTGDLVLYEGATYTEIEEAFEEAVDDYVQIVSDLEDKWGS